MLLRIILMLFSFSISSCKNQNSSYETKQILRLNLPDDPYSFDPRFVRNIKDLAIVRQLFEGLMRIDKEGCPQMALAEKVDISPDKLTYTFHLRDAYWSNGDPITAYDFEYAWTTILDSTFASHYVHLLYPIKNAKLFKEKKCSINELGIKVLDNKTLIVQLQFPTPYFLELIAFPTYYPIHRQVDILEKTWSHTDQHFVCNGPFYLKKWRSQSEIILKKNSFYWDHEAVHLDSICFTIIPDNCTENYLFEKNELDWLGQPISHNISTEVLSKLKETECICSYAVAGTFWFIFNTNQKPFDNVKFRRAFAYAINRQEIIDHILQGNQSIALSPIPPSMLNSIKNFSDADTHQAQKLFNEALAESKWTLQTLPKIVISYPPMERNIKIVQQVQQQWKKAFGIEVELTAVENKLYQSRVRQGEYLIGIATWVADFNDPISFLDLFKYLNDSVTGYGMNNTGWYNKTYTALLDQALEEINSEERLAFLSEAEKILLQEMPIIPVYHFAFDYIKKPYVQDVLLSPLGFIDFKTTKIQSPNVAKK